MAAERAAFRSLLRICRQADKEPKSLLSLIGKPPRMYNFSQNREVRMLWASSPFAEEMVWEALGRSTQFAHPRPGRGDARRACRQHRARALYMGLPYLKEAQDLYFRFNESRQVMTEIEIEQDPEDSLFEPIGGRGRGQPLQTFDPLSNYSIMPGDLLMTHPISCMQEPVFDQAVVLLHKNSDHPLTDSGVVTGLVLNKRLNTTFEQLLERSQDPQDKLWAEKISGLPGAEELNIYRGGPVIVGSSLQANLDWIHSFPDVSEARLVSPGIWYGGKLEEVLDRAAAYEDAPPVRIMLGYSAWSTLQLQIELECGVWCRARAIVDEGEPAGGTYDDPTVPMMFSFFLEGADAWRKALLCAGLDLFAHFPRAPGSDARLRGHMKRQESQMR